MPTITTHAAMSIRGWFAGLSTEIWNMKQKLLPSITADDYYFGRSVATNDGTYVVIGAPGTVISGSNCGAAYVYFYDGTSWTEQAVLLASDRANTDSFGESVSVSNDGLTIAVGAYSKIVGANSFQGSVYIFTRSGTIWSQEAKLVASDGVQNSRFGYSVSLSANGNKVMIGAPGDTVSGNTARGSAYSFTRSGTTWTQQSKLSGSFTITNSQFGESVSLSGDGLRAAIGSIGASSDGLPGGAAYIFYNSSGSSWEQTRLLGTGITNGDIFGKSVSINYDGSAAIVGNTPSLQQGEVYTFLRSGTTTWNQEQMITASDGSADNSFGHSVSIAANANVICVGSRRTDISGKIDQGASYIFIKTGGTWFQQLKLVAADGLEEDRFGISVAMNTTGNIAVIGADQFAGVTPNPGAAYIFST